MDYLAEPKEAEYGMFEIVPLYPLQSYLLSALSFRFDFYFSHVLTLYELANDKLNNLVWPRLKG